jgi:UDP-N-acetylglucosamine transferase subunit ALG13
MILVTVGTQMPFDRLVRTVDEWAGSHPGAEVFAQVGQSKYRPRHVRWVAELDPPEFFEKIETASAVIAHAGMGTILKAWELGKPIVVMPRRAALGEHRNDHQMATARRLQTQGRITVAFDEAELWTRLDTLGQIRPAERIAPQASPALLAALTAFVQGGAAGLPGVAGATDRLPASKAGGAVGQEPRLPTGEGV